MKKKIAYLSVVLLATASLLPFWAAWRHTYHLNDDTYITLTYVKNLANGNGFVFNHGPAVLGTTTPLLTLILAGLSSVCRTISIPSLAIFFTAFCWSATAWILYCYRNAWHLSDWQAAVLGVVIIASSDWVAYLGMEAYLFAMVLMLCLSLFWEKKYLAAGISSGFLFLTRGEGALIIGLLLMVCFFSNWKERKRIDHELISPLLKLMAGFSLPVGIWSVYAFLTFGNVLPNTLSAKIAQGQYAGGNFLPDKLIRKWLPEWGRYFRMTPVPAFNLWWIFTIAGIVSSLVRRSRWLIFAAWIILYAFGYTFLKVAAYDWYQIPILFVLNLFTGIGILTFMNHMCYGLHRMHMRAWTGVCLSGLFLLFWMVSTVQTVNSYSGYPRADAYLALSRWMNNHTCPNESVAFIEIGYLGYFTNNRIIDLAGLITPDITSHLAKRDLNWGFWRYQSDYYIYSSDFDWALSSINTNPSFSSSYLPVAEVDNPGGSRFVIFKRKRS